MCSKAKHSWLNMNRGYLNKGKAGWVLKKLIGLYHPLDGITNLKYKLTCFLTINIKISKRNALAFNWDRCFNLALCLRLIVFHYELLTIIKCLKCFFKKNINNKLRHSYLKKHRMIIIRCF
jgi:hypothetical protein